MKKEQIKFIERERIKDIIKRKFERTMEYREQLKTYRARHHLPLLEVDKLQRDILFLINHPHYVKIKERMLSEGKK